MEIEPCDFFNIFLKFWFFESHFLITFFLIKKRVFKVRKINIEQMRDTIAKGKSTKASELTISQVIS